MVNKFWAYYKSDKGIECVNIYQAMKLEKSLINNKDHKIEFWDMREFEKAEKVHTRRTSKDGRAASFVYYSGSEHVGVCHEMTMTHKIYQLVYSEAPYLVLKQFKKEIKIYIKNTEKEYYYRTKYNLYYIDIVVELERTEPAFYYYKWGGKIALEVYVSHKLGKSKINDLTEHGLQIFQIKILDFQMLPEDSFSLSKFDNFTEIVRSRFKKSNHKVYGKFLNEILPETNSLMEQRYKILENFEIEKQKLQEQINDNEEKINDQIDRIEKKNAVLHKLNEQCEEYKIEISKYKEQISRTDELIQNNQQLTNQNENAQATINELQKKLCDEKNKSLFKKILGR